jgi:acetyltransferase-like isoleucine patch superfamily enzyme
MMDMNSVDNYVWDCYIKSFENAEALLEDSNILSSYEKQSLLNLNQNAIDVWKKLYHRRVKYLGEHVKIKYNEDKYHVEKIEFHRKHGWVIQSKNEFVYLGKSSIYGDLELTIGNNSYFSGHSILRGVGKLNIGSFCSFAFNQYINVANQNHPISTPASIGIFNQDRLHNKFVGEGQKYSIPTSKNVLNIGNDVWFGQGVTVFTNINIGDGVVIGANSIVNKDCEPYGIYAGSPAKLIRHRFKKEVIEQLLEIKWWNWTVEKIKTNRCFFETDLNMFDGNLNTLIVL